MNTILDLAFPIVEGRLVAIDHAHALYGAIKHVAPALTGIGIWPLRGQPLGEWLQLRHHEHLRLRLDADRIAQALPLAGRELRVGSNLLRLGAPRIEALEPHANLYARTVVIAKGKGGEGNRPASELEVLATATAAAPGAKPIILGRRTLRIHGVQIPGFELVLEGCSPEVSLKLQSEGLGGRRAFGCGIFVNAGVRAPVVAGTAADKAEHA